jgi:hypothetical protein
MSELDKYRVGNPNTGMEVTMIDGESKICFAGLDLTQLLEDILERLNKLEEK